MAHSRLLLFTQFLVLLSLFSFSPPDIPSQQQPPASTSLPSFQQPRHATTMRAITCIAQPCTPIVFVVVLLFVLPFATAFQASIRSLSSSSSCSTTSTALAAVYYGLSEEDHEDEQFSSSSSSLTLDNNDGRKVPTSLLGPDWTAPLARLASARSSGVNIEDIHQVSVNRVDAVQLDIEAIVCERDDCVSLSVPVDLPRPCVDQDTEESFERCIVDNLSALDQANRDALASSKVFATEEEVELAKRVDEELTSLHDIEYPEWWSSSAMVPTEEVQQECATLCSILNEAEFQADLKSLVSNRCVFQEGDIFPGHVHVLQIGLSGLIVRATALQEENLMGITEIPIAFTNPATSTDTLREYVLSTVEQQTS